MLLKLYNKNNDPADLQRVIDLLNDGGLLIYPTDGRYAIGCHGLKERAIERICRLKGIDPKKNNLSIICYDLAAISEYAKVDNTTFKLMKRNLNLPQPARGGHPYAGQSHHPRDSPPAGRPHYDHHPAPRRGR